MTSHNSPVGVCFENLSVILNRKKILRNVTAMAPCGSATVIIGPNGAGKTTLLRCFLGEIPHEGCIYFMDAEGKRVNKPVIGYVPQQLQADAQLPLRVYEFLAMSQKRPLWLGCSRQSRKAGLEMLERVDATGLAQQRLGSLSGGEMRRVLLAAALARKPDILVLDEAEAGVDYRGERLFWELLDSYREKFGFTALMVSHNLSLAAHYATHVICLKKTVLAQGAPRQTLTTQNLMRLFGVPIHLYPAACDNAGPICPQCGAFSASEPGAPVEWHCPMEEAAPDSRETRI